MELDRIKIILEKYFEATATEAEEQELRDYFLSDGVSPELEMYKPMFGYFSQAGKERSAREVPLETKRKSFSYRWISIAAVLTLMFGLYFGKHVRDQREAEYAYQETRKAFGLIAQNLDRGTEKVAFLGEFEQTKQKILNQN
ncbi:hypothetical protein [Robiginitalea aurantiaca]|uniref:Uncharacterized protein n=1 Tax=Robiginitalea aurantiaca TaxID=3056915 RepID=A0ABT7WCA7_9FLAO|nr:hypothetical protein [Robiginitalea aurantiaca]MDM9630558.1 hypothetical protein [Robiginitalea aurantiaca]